jgi:thioredoxin-like negative regulator of GroEL
MNSKQHFFNIFLILLIIFNLSQCAELYDNNNSNVINLNKKNFDTQITLNRSKNIVSLVHYYKLDDGKSRGMKLALEKLAADYDLMFKVTAMNCKDFADLCEKNDVREFPTIKVYPPLPAPIMDYEGKLETPAIVSFMGKFIGNKVQELNNNNFDNFLQTDANIPKCILFTDKAGVPLIFKSLSVTFDVIRININFF